MPYSERVIFSAERNGMWYKYRKKSVKRGALLYCIKDKDQPKMQFPA